jgi:hypothetical protein
MAADFDHRLRHQDDLDHRVLADALAYRPWAIGQFGGAGAGPIHLPGDWTIVTPGADGAIPIEALREEKALPCYVDEVGDCQDLRTYLIAQHGGMQIGDIGTGVLSVGEAGWPASWLRAVRCDFRRSMAARWGSLPVPNRQHLGLITYDAKDPDTNFPPIEPLLPPEGAPNVLIVLLDDVGYGAGNPFGGPAQVPTAERLQSVPYHRVLRPDQGGANEWAQPPLGGYGSDHRNRDHGVEWDATEHQGSGGDDVETRRVLDGSVRQVPRGAAR